MEIYHGSKFKYDSTEFNKDSKNKAKGTMDLSPKYSEYKIPTRVAKVDKLSFIGFKYDFDPRNKSKVLIDITSEKK